MSSVLYLQIVSQGVCKPLSQQDGHLGIVLLNLGGPQGTLEDVRGFLYNLFSDPNIIRLPKCLSLVQKPIAALIATKRCALPPVTLAYRP